MSYIRLPFYSEKVEQLVPWVNDEFARIETELRNRELVEYAVAPTRPFSGMMVIANGTNWDPGSGRGVYWYDGTGWKYLG